MQTIEMIEMTTRGPLEPRRCSSAPKGMPSAEELRLKEIVASGSEDSEGQSAKAEEAETFDMPEEKGSQRMIFNPGRCAI
jgi:hypothetical protein